MPPVGFELTNSAGERTQTDALERAAIGIGFHHILNITINDKINEMTCETN